LAHPAFAFSLRIYLARHDELYIYCLSGCGYECCGYAHVVLCWRDLHQMSFGLAAVRHSLEPIARTVVRIRFLCEDAYLMSMSSSVERSNGLKYYMRSSGGMRRSDGAWASRCRVEPSAFVVVREV